MVVSGLLMGAYIGYAAGSFDFGMSRHKSALMPSSKLSRVFVPATEPSTPSSQSNPVGLTKAEAGRTLMPGSKSMILIEPSGTKGSGSESVAASPSRQSIATPSKTGNPGNEDPSRP